MVESVDVEDNAFFRSTNENGDLNTDEMEQAIATDVPVEPTQAPQVQQEAPAVQQDAPAQVNSDDGNSKPVETSSESEEEPTQEASS